MAQAATRLRTFRKKHNVSVRGAALALSVEHAAYVAWETERATPLAPYRRAIAIWTHGYVGEHMWPLSEREHAAEEALANVRPFKPTGS
jgi:DNA-binding XRE family transcriptional regulator